MRKHQQMPKIFLWILKGQALVLTVTKIVCKISVSETFWDFFLFKYEVFCQFMRNYVTWVNFESAWLTPVHPNELKRLKQNAKVRIFICIEQQYQLMNSLWTAAFCFWCLWQDDFCPASQLSKGGALSSSGKSQTVNHFRILSFKIETLNWPSFNEIGEMTCITHAWISPWEARNSKHLEEICLNQSPKLSLSTVKAARPPFSDMTSPGMGVRSSGWVYIIQFTIYQLRNCNMNITWGTTWWLTTNFVGRHVEEMNMPCTTTSWASAEFSHDVLPQRYILLVCSFATLYKLLSRVSDDISKLKY